MKANDIDKAVKTKTGYRADDSSSKSKFHKKKSGKFTTGPGHNLVESETTVIDSYPNKYRKLVPQPDNEAPMVCKLSGYTISTYVELCGWSFMAPTKFFNINASTHLHSMTDGRGEIVKEAVDLRTKCITLKEMQQLIGNPSNPVINCPVFVHVAAKKKIDLVPQNNRLFILPVVVIADKSGYGVLLSPNEGVDTIYNKLEVGDQLLISRCLPQQPRKKFHEGLFANYLDLELKLQYHSVRNHYIWKFSALQASHFQMPLELFDSNCQLMLPSELECPHLANHPWITLPRNKQYFDIIGVVAYVGRIERFQNIDNQDIECLVDGKIVVQTLRRFLLYRWIYLVDQTSSSTFPVKIFIHNITSHATLVPGAILVITHCQISDCSLSDKFITTSQFSQLYLDASIEKYYRIHPPTFRQKARQIMERQNYIKIISRSDVVLSIGGTHAIKICQEKLPSFMSENQSVYNDIPVDKPIQRRESVRLYFEGIILRTFEIFDENVPRVSFVHPQRYVTQMLRKQDGEYKIIENFLSYEAHKNSSWYAFQRKLPRYHSSVLSESKCRDIVKRIVACNKPYCRPLLIPAEMPDYNENGPPPPMAELERVDGTPYIMIDIVNEKNNKWYTCIWKTRQLTMQEKIDKVNAAKNKKVAAIVEVFCTEQTSPLEVNLLDFVTME